MSEAHAPTPSGSPETLASGVREVELGEGWKAAQSASFCARFKVPALTIAGRDGVDRFLSKAALSLPDERKLACR